MAPSGHARSDIQREHQLRRYGLTFEGPEHGGGRQHRRHSAFTGQRRTLQRNADDGGKACRPTRNQSSAREAEDGTERRVLHQDAFPPGKGIPADESRLRGGLDSVASVPDSR